jgi:hypothetical protein
MKKEKVIEILDKMIGALENFKRGYENTGYKELAAQENYAILQLIVAKTHINNAKWRE